MEEQKIAHLGFIKDTIERMSGHSFSIKGWMITLVSALFALAAKDSNVRYVLVTYIAIPSFWVLDGFFLSIERKYCDLYDEVRQTESDRISYSMRVEKFNQGKNTWPRSIFSLALCSFYLPIIGIALIVMFWIR
jgi:hypothetical protein